MEAMVLRAFRHANSGVTYAAGDAFRGTESQARELCAMGYVTIAEEREPEPGVREDPALEDMTVAQLKELCEGYGIEVPSKAKKDNLVAAVRLFLAETEAEGAEGGADGPEGE